MPEELKDVSVSLDVGAVKAGAGYDLVKQKVSQKAWAALAKLNLGLDQISLPNGCVLDASLSLALGAIGRETSIKPHDVTFFIGAGQFGAGGHLQWECAPMDSLSPQ